MSSKLGKKSSRGSSMGSLTKIPAELPSKFADALKDLHHAVDAWNDNDPEAVKGSVTDQATAGKVASLLSAPSENEPLYEKSMLKKLYRQLQDLSKDESKS